jgi:hypothetical protein
MVGRAGQVQVSITALLWFLELLMRLVSKCEHLTSTYKRDRKCDFPLTLGYFLVAKSGR